VPRPLLHDPDEVLDAARDLLVEGGPRAAGIRAIAERSGAPSGSLYHRFGSRDELVARTWLRAVRRFQDGYVAALGDGVEDAVRWAVAFALEQPGDAHLLLRFGRHELLDTGPGADLAAELSTVNEPLQQAVRRLARRTFGTANADAVERTTYAVIDLPLAVLTRQLRAGTLTRATADRLAAAVRALLVATTSRK
jgi:AcrR family transcriptional regulator